MRQPYDHRQCQSLFGYAARVHAQSGGICQLCGYGTGKQIDFDLWRQLTVEHLIGESQAGYPKAIRQAIATHFPMLSPVEQARLVQQIDELNTVTACSFCNATTSRDVATARMDELILTADTPDEAIAAIETMTRAILQEKQESVAWKLSSVRIAFDRDIAPLLQQRRVPDEMDGGHGF